MKKEDKKLIDILKLGGLEKPSEDFLSMVMEQVETVPESAFQQNMSTVLFKEEALLSPSLSFEDELFDKLQVNKKYTWKPIISKWTLLFMGITFAGISILIGIEETNASYPGLLPQLNFDFSTLVERTVFIRQWMVLVLIIILGLFSLDSVLVRKKLQS